jgi:hypothetical protein
MRFDNVFGRKVNDQLLAAWIELDSSGIVYSDKSLARSLTDAIHAGVWEHYRLIPIITVDSRGQKHVTEVALDKLLGLLRNHVVPLVDRLLWRYDYNNWDRQQV